MNHQQQLLNPSGFEERLPVNDFWPTHAYTAYTDSVHITQAPPFFQDCYSNLAGYEGHLKVDPFSGQNLYSQYQTPDPPSRLYNFTQRARPAQTPLPPQKRQKIQPVVELGEQDGTQSECCSSCPSGVACDEPNCTPCDKTDCEEQLEEVIPCTRKSCAEAVCPNPCLNVAVQQQEAALNNGIVPTERRISSWDNTQWNSEVPRSQGSRTINDLLDPALEGFNSPVERHVSGSPAPMSPSMAKNVDTPHSPSCEAPTPHSSLFPQLTQAETAAGILSGAGALFNPTLDSQWQHFGQQNHVNSQFTFECPWTDCGQPFVDMNDYRSHFHKIHIDPQMTFYCPEPTDSCPSAINSNPLEHLQNDHGYNFNMGTGGFSCPAASCPQGETFLNPAMLHSHFDSVHSIPAHGFLQCRVDTCGNYYQDFNQLWSHVTEQHQIPQQPKDDTGIDLGFPMAPILATEPLIEADSKATASKPEAGAEIEPEEDLHVCKWKLESGRVCSVECESEDVLQKHIKQAHLDVLDKKTGYRCRWEGCNREEKVPKDKVGFTQRGKLERHMATHTNYKSSRCDWPGCGKLFSAPQAMRQHYLLHTGEKPWECKHCGKKFPQQSACTIHERTHTKEKPLECNICGMKFSESSNLSKHRRTHEDKQSHECTFPGCGKSFCRLDQLRRHKLVHRKRGEDGDGEAESVTERTESGESERTA